MYKRLQNPFLDTVSPSLVSPAPQPPVPSLLFGVLWAGRAGGSQELGQAPLMWVFLCLPADDCLWGFLTQGLLLPELLQHLGLASGQRVPHLLRHPVSRTPQPLGRVSRNGCQDMKSLPAPPHPSMDLRCELGRASDLYNLAAVISCAHALSSWCDTWGMLIPQEYI